MDKRLLEINQIKDIISIDYKDMYYGGNQEKRHIMPGFLVFYGNLKSMYLTIDDPYFEEFVRRIRSVYLEEKDYIQDGVLKNKKILINSLTESILLNGSLDNISSLYSFYDKKDSYGETLLFESDKLHAFFNIIEYHLRIVLKTYAKTLEDVKLSDGANGNYYLSGVINNESVLLPLFFENDDNSYHIVIGNVLEDSLPLNMDILFMDNKISVRVDDRKHNITDISSYNYENGRVKEKRLVIARDELIGKSEDILDKVDNPSSDLAALDNDLEEPTWFLLPWGGYLGFNEKIDYIASNGDITNEETDKKFSNKRMVYVTREDNSFYIKDFYSKRYICNSKDIASNKDVVLDYLNKKIIGIKNDDGYVVETSFTGPGRTGYYKAYLEDKYYYHMCLEKDISKFNLIPLSRESGLEDKVDLIRLNKIRKN